MWIVEKFKFVWVVWRLLYRSVQFKTHHQVDAERPSDSWQGLEERMKHGTKTENTHRFHTYNKLWHQLHWGNLRLWKPLL